MEKEYLKIISEYCTYRNANKRFKRLSFLLLRDNEPFIYELLMSIDTESDEYNEEQAIQGLQKHKRNDIKYLNYLVSKYFETRNTMIKIEPNRNNIDKISSHLFMMPIILDEIIDTLRNMKLDEKNKMVLRNCLVKLTLDKLFTDGYLRSDSIIQMVYQALVWQTGETYE